MSSSLRWTSGDLEMLPDDGKRYEIIDGELYVSDPRTWDHQLVELGLAIALDHWDKAMGAGVVNIAPGLIFADDDVTPDLVWLSRERLAAALGTDGKLHAAPDLVVEVISPGPTNGRRDREIKLQLYARRGVREYWIVDWQRRQIEIYRRADATLHLAATLLDGDVLESRLLPGFSLSLCDLFARVR